MKKPLLYMLAIVLIALLVVSVVLCVEFFGLYGQTNQEKPSDATNPPLSELENFAREQWGAERAELQSPGRLVLYRSYEITYAQACAVGGNIFVDDLAPERYVPLTLTIAADIATKFAFPSIVVELCYLSTDGEVIFRADSNGVTQNCWEE